MPHSVEKAEMERLSKEVSTLQKTLIDLPTSSKVFELAEHKWDESVQKTTSVLQEKLAGVVDPRIQVTLYNLANMGGHCIHVRIFDVYMQHSMDLLRSCSCIFTPM